MSSDGVSETEYQDIFTRLQLDTFHALWNLCVPSKERDYPLAQDGMAKKLPALSRKEALSRFLIGTKLEKAGRGRQRVGGAARAGLRLLLAVLACPLRGR